MTTHESSMSEFRVLTDPAEADEAFAVGVCWCEGEFMSPQDSWHRPSDSWEDYTYSVRSDWVGTTVTSPVVPTDPASPEAAAFINTLLTVGRAPEPDPAQDTEWVEFDFVVPARDRERTEAILRAMVEAGWLATDVISSRGVDLDDLSTKTADGCTDA